MKSADQEKFKEELLKRRRELVESFKRSQEARRQEGDEGTQDIADKATEYYTQEFNYNLSEKDRQQLAAIDDALERIELDEYGECEECGEEISERRLQAIPWAALCIDCQEKKEAAAQQA
ncbi:MAG: TraR/DksA family transcriptional regulator [Acidobacteriota bacterium]